MILNFKFEKEEKKRLDKFLAENLPDFSREEIIKWIKNEKVLVNQKKVKPHLILELNDEIFLEFEEKKNELKPNSKIKLDIIFENENFSVINKPCFLQVHPDSKEKENTLVNALLFLYPEIKSVGEDWQRPGIIHRLDKDTSGLMLVAKNNESFFELKKMFQERKIQKTYLALVWGKMKERIGLIDLPIAKNTSFQKQKIAFGKFGGQSKEAQTEYKVLEEFEMPFEFSKNKKIWQKNLNENLFNLEENKIYLSLIEARPKTGRTHQIRVHFSHLGNPLVNDFKYYQKIYNDLPSNFIENSTFLLHSSKLDFTFKNEVFSFFAPLPNYFENSIKNIKKIFISK